MQDIKTKILTGMITAGRGEDYSINIFEKYVAVA